MFLPLPLKSVFCVLRYVIVECEDQDTQQRDPKTHEMYLNVMRRFSQALLKVQQHFFFTNIYAEQKLISFTR